MKVVELAGGVGGAKLAEGLAAHVGPDLTVVVNTGDDLELHGLAIWPDHDTVAYTLAGLDDEVRGWGLRDETWTVMDRLEAARATSRGSGSATGISRPTCGGPTGCAPERDRPSVALELAAALGIAPTILPMTDDTGPDRGPSPTTAGSNSRSTSSTATRSRTCARSASMASRRQPDARGPGGSRRRRTSSSSRHRTRSCRSVRSSPCPA